MFLKNPEYTNNYILFPNSVTVFNTEEHCLEHIKSVHLSYGNCDFFHIDHCYQESYLYSHISHLKATAVTNPWINLAPSDCT